ncbi:MAG TPA: hypothetical protein VFZ72_11490 [Jiangellaceae bacterium]
METMQQWCAGCASVREFVRVPDSWPDEYACTRCDAAVVVLGEQPPQARLAVLV